MLQPAPRRRRYASGAAGPFTLDDQIALIAEAIRRCEEPPHVAALCQGGAPSLAALKERFWREPERYLIPLSAASRRESFDR